MDEKAITIQPPAPITNPFLRQQNNDHLAAGTVTIESERAIAEAQGKLAVAKRFPRDPARAYDKIMAACQRPALAQEALYQFNRGGASVTGPSIRLAEELARCWGNIDYGLGELSNKDGVTEMEAYAHDLETNTFSRQRFTVRHIRDTKSGPKGLTDQRDIYEVAANNGARRMRARILAILPADIVDAAVAKCRETLAGKSEEPMTARVQKMIGAFGPLGVTVKHLEEKLGHPLDATTPDELVDLRGICTSIRDGQTRVADWFGVKVEPPGLASVAAAPPAAEKTAVKRTKNTPAPVPMSHQEPPKTLPVEDNTPAGKAERAVHVDNASVSEDMF